MELARKGSRLPCATATPNSPRHDADARHSVIPFRLGQQALCLRHLDEIGEAGLIAGARLGLRLACGGQRDGSILRNLHRRLVSGLRGGGLARQVLQGLLVLGLLAAFLRFRHALLIAPSREIEQIGKHHGDAGQPVAAVKAQSLHASGISAVGIRSAAARKGLRFHKKAGIIGMVNDALSGAQFLDARLLVKSQRMSRGRGRRQGVCGRRGEERVGFNLNGSASRSHERGEDGLRLLLHRLRLKKSRPRHGQLRVGARPVRARAEFLLNQNLHGSGRTLANAPRQLSLR